MGCIERLTLKDPEDEGIPRTAAPHGVPLRLIRQVRLQVCVSPCLAQNSSQEANGLYSLAQAHVVRQDAALVLGVLPE